MQYNISQAQSYLDLLDREDSAYNFKDIFDDNGYFKKKLCHRKFILLKNILPVLDVFKEKDEYIHYLSFGMLNKVAEQIIGGWAMIYLNRHAFIFTSKRILFVQLRGKFKVSKLKTMLDYSSIKKTKEHFFGSLSIVLNTGKKLNFVGIPRGDRKFIHENINKITSIIPVEKKTNQGIINLCPKCGIRIQGFPIFCNQCKTVYKSPLKAALLSLIFPGLGDMYLGHYGFGLMEILGAFLAWGIIVMPLLISSSGGIETLVIFLGTLLLMHVPDALFTAYVARKGIYPA